jgi:hypothetical protein
MKDRIDELLEITYNNNSMLKEIIKYINYINSNAENENNNDFIRNVIANVVSSTLPDLKKFKK